MIVSPGIAYSNNFKRIGTAPAEKQGPVDNSVRNVRVSENKNGKFADILNSKISDIRFSKHAAKRIKSRSLVMNSMETKKLKSAVDAAARKGSRESLCLIGNKAFVVNIPNRTVITAMNKDEIADKIITNIDSAVMY